MRLFEAVVDFIVSLISAFKTREIAFASAFAILMLGCLVYLAWILRPHISFVGAVRRASKLIKSARANTTWSAEDRLANVDNVLAKNAVLGVAWTTYRRGLRCNPRKDTEFVNLVDPYAWFALERLPGRGYEKWATTMAGVSLIVGLLFTFVGLSAALFRVGDAGADTAQLRVAIADILQISSAKFITSMAGIVAYIAWALAARFHASAQSKVVLDFATEVQSLTAPCTPEALLLDQLEESREQTSRLRTLADDMAVAFDASLTKVVGQRIDALPAAVGAALQPALESSVQPVVDAIQGMGSSIGAGNHSALEGMISGLVSGVHDATGREMQALVEAMQGAANELKTAKSGIGASGTEFSEMLARAAQGMEASSMRMVEAMERRAGEIDARMHRIDETLVAGASNFDAMGATMSERMAQGLRSAMEGIATAAQAGAATAREQAQAGLAPVLSELTILMKEMRNSAEESGSALMAGGRSASQDLGAALGNASELLARAAEGMNASAVRMADAMEHRAAEIDSRMQRIDQVLSSGASRFDSMGATMNEHMSAGLNNTMQSIAAAAQAGAATAREQAQAGLAPVLNELKALMGEIRNSADESRGVLVAGSQSAARELGAAMANVGGTLSGASSRASDVLVQSFQDATASMVAAVENAVGGYRAATDALATRMTNVEQSFGVLERSVRQSAEQLEGAGNNLTAAGRTFGTAAAQVERATAPVLTTLTTVENASASARDALRLVLETSSAVRDTAAAMTASSRSAIDAFQSYERRFEGVDASLGQTVAKMRDGVIELGNHVTEVVKQYDEHLARAVGQLRVGVDELSEALEGVGDKMAAAA